MSDEAAEARGLDSRAVRVRSGNPTDEELAAVIAVLSAASATRPEKAAQPAAPPRPSGWARSQRALRSWDQSDTWS